MPNPNNKKKIKKKVTQVKGIEYKINTELKEENYDNKKGRIAFSSVSHSQCPISDWQGEELKSLIETFKNIESLSWKEIMIDSGLKWERNKNIAIPLPNDFPQDANLCSMRVSKKMRIYGYRAQEYFYIVWFDRNHEVCPIGKQKRYKA